MLQQRLEHYRAFVYYIAIQKLKFFRIFGNFREFLKNFRHFEKNFGAFFGMNSGKNLGHIWGIKKL